MVMHQYLYFTPDMSWVDLVAILYTVCLWVMMILLPRWEYTIKLLRTPFSLLPHLLLYAYLSLPSFGFRMAKLLNPQSAAYARVLLGTDGMDWLMKTHQLDLHLLAFNLFVGRWIFWEGRNVINPVLLALCLFLTMWSGPLGLACYLLVVKLKEGIKSL